MIKLRDYQKEASEKLTRLCNNYGHGYLSGECRTGKTLVALSVVKNMDEDKVLIITKKKAISSIKKDIDLMDLTDKVVVTNFEQLKILKVHHGILSLLMRLIVLEHFQSHHKGNRIF